jgi:transcriptional regulator
MHPNAAFRLDDRDTLRTYAEGIGFGMMFAATQDGPKVVPRVAHVPFVFTGEDRIAFHIARGNAIARHLDTAQGLFVVNGPDGYISPDYYGTPDQVPTWNYLAIEFEGTVHALSHDDLVAQIDALSSQQEARLAPKQPWTRDKMTAGLFDKMLSAITGFEMTITAWRGTAKFNQNKDDATRSRAASAVRDAGKIALAELMEQAN